MRMVYKSQETIFGTYLDQVAGKYFFADFAKNCFPGPLEVADHENRGYFDIGALSDPETATRKFPKNRYFQPKMVISAAYSVRRAPLSARGSCTKQLSH